MNTSSGYFKFINFVIFKLIWVAAVVYRYEGLWVCVSLLALHFMLSEDREADFHSTYKAILLGVGIDFTMMEAGVYVFNSPGFPVWLICIWIGFALLLRHGMSWLGKKPVYWQVLFGACGGTLSYLSGAKLGAVEFTLTQMQTIFALATIWGTVVPTFFWLMREKQTNAQMA